MILGIIPVGNARLHGVLNISMRTPSLLALLVVLPVTGCQHVPMLPSLAPHKIDVRQGNNVTQDMVAKLKPGMTRSQVRFALGTPLLIDPFRNDRWDYVFHFSKAGAPPEQRRIAVFFADDKLVRVQGDVVPAPPETGPAAAAGAKP